MKSKQIWHKKDKPSPNCTFSDKFVHQFEEHVIHNPLQFDNEKSDRSKCDQGQDKRDVFEAF